MEIMNKKPIDTYLKKEEVSPIMGTIPGTTKHHYLATKDLSLTNLKKKSKSLGVSLNEYLCAEVA